LTHALEIVLLFGVFFVLFVPRLDNSVANAVLYLAISVGLTALATLTAAITARLTVKRAFRFYWLWGGLAAAAAMVMAVIG
jgi:NADH-quinone oxidoreductase subunit H